MWTPDLTNGGTPRYQAIADAIARDVNQGHLKSGQRLPTHRALAERLGVTVGTVTRGYAEAERRGLTRGEVGRGTFVRGRRDLDAFERSGVAARAETVGIDLSLALPWIPPDGSDGRALAAALGALAEDDLDEALAYHATTAPVHQLEAFSAWLSERGLPTSPDRMLVTAGSQHGLLVALSTMLAPGDQLLTAELTYPGIRSLSRTLGLRLRGVPLDGEGMVPEALDRLFRETHAPAVYCIPTSQNPTCATMSEERRLELADVAWSHGALIIEDDPYRVVTDPDLPSLYQLAPERTIHVTTLSKAITFGLRVGFVVASAEHARRLRSGVRASMWMAPPLMGEVALRWLEDGTAAAMIEAKQAELRARHALLRERLPQAATCGTPPSIHAWVPLPEPWRAADFVEAARKRGVHLAGTDAFTVGRQVVPHAVRLSLGREPRRDRLTEALDTLADLLGRGVEPCRGIL